MKKERVWHKAVQHTHLDINDVDSDLKYRRALFCTRSTMPLPRKPRGSYFKTQEQAIEHAVDLMEIARVKAEGLMNDIKHLQEEYEISVEYMMGYSHIKYQDYIFTFWTPQERK